MNRTKFPYIALILALMLLFSACASSEQQPKENLPISCPDAFSDVMSISDGQISVFDLLAGVSYNELVGDIFSEDELDLQFYSENGKVTMKQPLTFSETLNEKWLISFYFVDERLTRISAGITFLETPLAEASACIAALRDAYQAKFGDEVFFREEGPSFEQLADGDMRHYFVEWILDERGGAHISAVIRDDLKSAGITKQDFSLEASVIFLL